MVDERNVPLKTKSNIISSINYAKRILCAACALDPKKLQNYYLNLLFYFCLERHIVSGDFYWIEQQSDK
jgi:hypothetical protein